MGKKTYAAPARPAWCEIWQDIHNDAQHEITREECEECRHVIALLGPMPLRNMMKRYYEGLKKPEFKTPIPQKLRKAVFERDGYTCRHCGATTNLAADHIVPEARGGKATMENLQTLCRSCNSRKSDR